MENDSYTPRMKNYEMMAFGGKKWKQLMKCSGWVKRILIIENNYERMAASLNFTSLRERIRFGGKTLLWSSNAENDDDKTPP